MWVDLDHICAPTWPRPDLRSMSRSRSFWSCEKCTFLGLSHPPFSRGAQNWWLAVIVWVLDYSLLESNVDISRNSNGYISVVRDATVTRLGKLLVIHVLCMLMWPWTDPRSMSRSRTIWTSDNCPLLHISRSISSATFAYSSKVMLGGDSMGPRLQPVGARFLHFLLRKLSREFKLRRMSIFHEIKTAIFR